MSTGNTAQKDSAHRRQQDDPGVWAVPRRPAIGVWAARSGLGQFGRDPGPSDSFLVEKSRGSSGRMGRPTRSGSIEYSEWASIIGAVREIDEAVDPHVGVLATIACRVAKAGTPFDREPSRVACIEPPASRYRRPRRGRDMSPERSFIRVKHVSVVTRGTQMTGDSSDNRELHWTIVDYLAEESVGTAGDIAAAIDEKPDRVEATLADLRERNVVECMHRRSTVRWRLTRWADEVMETGDDRRFPSR